MASPEHVRTQVTELPESRVRVEAEVPADEVERRVQQAAKAIGRQMRLPGFRKGKVPPPVVIKRVGRASLLDEAIKESLPGWYGEAIEAAGIEPVGDPSLDLEGLPGEGEPLVFRIEIGVRPEATLGEYRGLEVGRREPEVSGEAIEAELEQLRERLAKLETVDRPAGNGDFVVVDFAGTIEGEGFAGGEARDELLELGSGQLPEGFEEQLAGASAGEERSFPVAFPEDYPAEQFAGREARFEVTVKEVKAKEVPELDDDFAADAAGFDSLDELRADIRTRLLEGDQAAVDAEFREAVVDAAAAAAQVDVPDELVQARASEQWERVAHTLSHRDIGKDVYLQMAGKSEEEIVAEAKPDAERALRHEAVLAAIVEAEGIEASEEEVLEVLQPAAEREEATPQALLERLREAGRLPALQRDLATRKAVDVLADSAQPITVEQAQARDKLWTPGREEAPSEGGGRLWTPGD